MGSPLRCWARKVPSVTFLRGLGAGAPMGEWDEKRIWSALWNWVMGEGVDDVVLCEGEG